jgi:hypothetical protein
LALTLPTSGGRSVDIVRSRAIIFINNINYFMVNDYFKAPSISFSKVIFHAFCSKGERFIFNRSLVCLEEIAFQEKELCK